MFTCTSADEASEPAFGCICHSPAFARLNALVTQKFSRRSFLAGAGAMAVAGALAFWPKEARAGIPDAPAKPIAFTNIKLFDGKSGKLLDGQRVVVDGNKIKAVEPAAEPVAESVEVIDCGGRTLMPGLIDAHWHSMMAAIGFNDLLTADVGYINLVAADQAEKTLMRGFTAIRDLAGPSFGLKRAIDTGLTPGPRIFPSGAMISQTSGHGDYRMPYEVPAAMDAPLSRGEAINGGMIADGPDQVMKRVREQLMLGASQIKLAAGGGVASNYDPIDVTQYTEAEFRAAVDCAENWGTYVTVHAYTSRAIQTAIRGGVRCIDHGQLMNEQTAKIMADKDIWLSSQPFLDDEDANPQPEGSINRAKQIEVSNGTDTAYGFAKQYKLKTAWGTDILFDPASTKKHGKQLSKMVRWYSPDEVLKTATSTNAELLAMSGPRNPYPGKLGVIETGAYADILLIDGDPIADIKLIADPDKNLKVIMKDGRIYKNTLG
ncbi:amidohydrolase family protein [Mesorhizobium sp. VK25A]|uniref:Amidohydrolase family protein n=1 Tax=Mesorhizobium vachelliae TaxID=3072309 RepID=A0ABU5A0S7_9HYPH|nr:MULTISPECIES: amidohydrolase family protein [unclassified Mesorhizobium]MDX8530827.1 amidohydrolase family protein [Mesorhizobium sp. VK25D]MDX8543422.1 amidohydrolase family protein [Mesorhizobium sp. VK25A]